MSIFGTYAQYYDLVYCDKDYESEADFVHALIQEFLPGAITILELGCGTGVHARHLAENGYTVCGVDMSAEMLRRAEERKGALPCDLSDRLSFVSGDVRNIRLERSFDVVVSLFHVMNYQTTNDDLMNAFATAGAHLEKGGIFLFDSWYGPAVLTDRPTEQTRHFANDELKVSRLSRPIMNPNENIVDVNFDVKITDSKTGATETLQEVHRMRYLFEPEIELFMSCNGFKLRDSRSWMDAKTLGFDAWNTCFLGEKLQ